MPEDLIQDTSQDVLADDFNQPTATQVADEPTPDSQGDQGGRPFGDLPFEKAEDLVKAYKDLQGAYTQGRVDYYDLRRQLNELLPLLQQARGQEPTTPTEDEITAAIGDFFKKGPKATLDSIISPLQRKVEQIEQQNVMFRKEAELNRFLKENPNLTTDDETRLVQIIKMTPRITAMTSIYDQLDAALDKLIRMEPTRFSAREKSGETSDDLNSAKKSASLGSKGGAKGSAKAKDEFDDILEISARDKARWR